jgi:hypothetical protein
MSNPFSRTARSEACRFLKQRLREQAKADDQNAQRNDNNEQENAVHDCQCQRPLNRSLSMRRNDARFGRVEREVVQPPGALLPQGGPGLGHRCGAPNKGSGFGAIAMFGKELGGDKYDCSKADGEHRHEQFGRRIHQLVLNDLREKVLTNNRRAANLFRFLETGLGRRRPLDA